MRVWMLGVRLFFYSLSSYSGACLGSCLQGKWRFKNLPFDGPCWKLSTFPKVTIASANLLSSSRSLAFRTMIEWGEARPTPLLSSFEFKLLTIGDDYGVSLDFRRAISLMYMQTNWIQAELKGKIKGTAKWRSHTALDAVDRERSLSVFRRWIKYN